MEPEKESFLRPMMRNSASEELKIRRFADNQRSTKPFYSQKKQNYFERSST